MGQSPGQKRGPRKLANIQRSPPPSSGMMHSSKQEVRQKCQEAHMVEQGAPGQTHAEKWWKIFVIFIYMKPLILFCLCRKKSIPSYPNYLVNTRKPQKTHQKCYKLWFEEVYRPANSDVR